MEIVSFIVKSIATFIKVIKTRRRNRNIKKYILKEGANFDGVDVRDIATTSGVTVFDSVTQMIFKLKKRVGKNHKHEYALIPIKRLKKDKIVAVKRGESRNKLFMAGREILPAIVNTEPILLSNHSEVTEIEESSEIEDRCPPPSNIDSNDESEEKDKSSKYSSFPVDGQKLEKLENIMTIINKMTEKELIDKLTELKALNQILDAKSSAVEKKKIQEKMHEMQVMEEQHKKAMQDKSKEMEMTMDSYNKKLMELVEDIKKDKVETIRYLDSELGVDKQE